MRNASPTKLLVVMIVIVPVVVAGAVLVSVLMLRAGYGLVPSGLLPLLAMLAVVGTLGVFLGRTAGRTREREDDRNRERDGV